MKHIVFVGISLFTMILSGRVIAERDFSNVQIKTTRVTNNIYMLEGSGGNIGVSVGADGILMIDDQYAPLSDKIKAALKKLGSDKPKFILNTHWHGDHVGGNKSFGREGTIIAHDNVRKRLATDQMLFGETVKARSPEALPVITFDESLSIHFNGEEIQVIHFPNSHTDGDGVIFFTQSNVVHMGDLMFMGMFPFVDLDHGGNVLGVATSISQIIPKLKPDVKIIPGHGPLSDLNDLKTYHRMLIETTDVVKSALAAGKTLEQIKATSVPDQWNSWGTGFIKTDEWLETIYYSLKND